MKREILFLSVIERSGKLNGIPIKKGIHFILPAAYGHMKMQGCMTLMTATVNTEKVSKGSEKNENWSTRSWWNKNGLCDWKRKWRNSGTN